MTKLIDRITVNAQSSIRIDLGKILRFDPFLLKEEPHDADVIFITHSHPDHFSPEDIKKVLKPETLFVAPESMKADIEKAGIAAEKCLFVNPGESAEIAGVSFKALPAYNIGRPFHTPESRWVGYAVELEGELVYAAGDTDGLDEIAALPITIALMPVGGKFTTDAREAAEFINKMKPKIAVPIHFGGMPGTASADREFIAAVEPTVKVVRKLILE